MEFNKTDGWIKYGKTSKGVQIYRNVITKAIKRAEYQGASNEVKLTAVMMYLKGLSLRSTADVVGVSHATISNWFKETYKAFRNNGLVDTNKVYKNVEIDEMWHFCKKKLIEFGL